MIKARLDGCSRCRQDSVLVLGHAAVAKAIGSTSGAEYLPKSGLLAAAEDADHGVTGRC
jgi:hypothetical protein